MDLLGNARSLLAPRLSDYLLKIARMYYVDYFNDSCSCQGNFLRDFQLNAIRRNDVVRPLRFYLNSMRRTTDLLLEQLYFSQ